ncbi:MAG TPA: transcriptional repressor LexA [Elainellaceae cyanobacterium]
MKVSRITSQQLLNWIEDFIYHNGISPTVREMADAFEYSSPSSIQNMLAMLRQQGDIDWIDRKSRSIRVLRPQRLRIPILGMIAAHSLLDTFPDTELSYLDSLDFLLAHWSRHEISQMFALRVRGDSMKDAMIADNDIVVMKSSRYLDEVKNGDIVAARVDSQTTLKYFYRSNPQITLQPANPNYPPTTLDQSRVHIQGVYVGLVRGLI